MFGLVWRSLRGGWPAWLAMGFASYAAAYGAMSAGLLNAELFVAPSRPVAMLALIGVVLITIGVIDYVGTQRQLAKRLILLAVGVAAVSVPLGITGVITRASGHLVMAVY